MFPVSFLVEAGLLTGLTAIQFAQNARNHPRGAL